MGAKPVAELISYHAGKIRWLNDTPYQSAGFRLYPYSVRCCDPDILSALKMAARALDGQYPWPIDAKFTQKEAREVALKHVNAAITKATGG